MADYVIAGTRDMSGGAKVTGSRRIAQRLIRRLGMPKGSSCADANIGLDLADAIQDTMTAGDVALLKVAIRAELEKDDDVRTCLVEASYSLSTKTLDLRITAIGPKVTVTFTAAATSGGVELLNVEGE